MHHLQTHQALMSLLVTNQQKTPKLNRLYQNQDRGDPMLSSVTTMTVKVKGKNQILNLKTNYQVDKKARFFSS